MSKEEVYIKDLNQVFNGKRMLGKMRQKWYEPQYHHTEINCIALIDQMDEANVTKLSDSFDMTRGGISKTIQKLLSNGLIESYQGPTNRKEIYFKLTEAGQEVLQRHQERKKKQQIQEIGVFNQFTEVEQETILKFLNQYNGYLSQEIVNMNQLFADMKEGQV